MNVFIRAMVIIFSFCERWNVLINSAIASLNRTFHLSQNENIPTIARIKTFIICIIYNATRMIYQANKTCFHRNHCRTHTFYRQTIFLADRKSCRTTPNFDFFSRANVRCPALFQSLIFRIQLVNPAKYMRNLMSVLNAQFCIYLIQSIQPWCSLE